MADLHSTDFVSHSQEDVSCPLPLYQELNSLITRLGKIMQELDRSNLSPVHKDVPKAGCDQQVENEPSSAGEYRTYYFSPFLLKYEKTIFETYNAKNLEDILSSTCIMLESQSQLLMLIQPEREISTFIVQQWGTLLHHLLIRFQSVQEVIHDMELVSTSKK